jgi:hypothetical protein
LRTQTIQTKIDINNRILVLFDFEEIVLTHFKIITIIIIFLNPAFSVISYLDQNLDFSMFSVNILVNSFP